MPNEFDLKYTATRVKAPSANTLPGQMQGHLRLLEMYRCLQGEGIFVGVPSLLIRTAGCSVGCSFCDTKFSWHARKSENLVSTEDLITRAQVEGEGLNHYIISGGEPLEQPHEELIKLVRALTGDGRRTHLVTFETSGVVLPPQELTDMLDVYWSISPKLPSAQGNYALPELWQWLFLERRYGSRMQFKFVVTARDPEALTRDLDVLLAEFRKSSTTHYGLPVFFQACTPNTGDFQEDLRQVTDDLRALEWEILKPHGRHPLFDHLQDRGFMLAVRMQSHFLTWGHARRK